MPDERMFGKLSEAISQLVLALRGLREQKQIEFEWYKSHHGLATKNDLDKMEGRIMSKIGDFAEAQNAFNDRVDTAITGLQGDIKALNDKITELQNSAGQITPEDQALLDSLQARGQTIADKLEALDALTPPVPPTT